jgi:hypothetical protein
MKDLNADELNEDYLSQVEYLKMTEVNHPEVKGSFSSKRRRMINDSARDAWVYFNEYRVNDENQRFLGSAISIISTIIGLTTSAMALGESISSKTHTNESLRLTIRLHNRTPFPLMLHQIQNVNVNAWNTPVVLSGQSAEFPVVVGDYKVPINAIPTFSLIDSNQNVINRITVKISQNISGNMIRVIETHFLGQEIMHDPFPLETFLDSGIVIYRGNTYNGYIPSVISTSVPDGYDLFIDLSVMVRKS